MPAMRGEHGYEITRLKDGGQWAEVFIAWAMIVFFIGAFTLIISTYWTIITSA